MPVPEHKHDDLVEWIRRIEDDYKHLREGLHKTNNNLQKIVLQNATGMNNLQRAIDKLNFTTSGRANLVSTIIAVIPSIAAFIWWFLSRH